MAAKRLHFDQLSVTTLADIVLTQIKAKQVTQLKMLSIKNCSIVI